MDDTKPQILASQASSASQDAAADWQEFTATDGRRYYYNNKTKQSSWEKPFEMMTLLERADASTVWKEFTTAEGKKYYYNKDTKQSKWSIPDELKLAREQAEKEASRGTHSPATLTSSTLDQLSASVSSSNDVSSPVGVTPVIPVTNEVAESSFGCAARGLKRKRGACKNLILEKALENNDGDPLLISFDIDDQRTYGPVGKNASMFKSLVGAWVRYVPLYHDSWEKVPADKDHLWKTIERYFDMKAYLDRPENDPVRKGVINGVHAYCAERYRGAKYHFKNKWFTKRGGPEAVQEIRAQPPPHMDIEEWGRLVNCYMSEGALHRSKVNSGNMALQQYIGTHGRKSFAGIRHDVDLHLFPLDYQMDSFENLWGEIDAEDFEFHLEPNEEFETPKVAPHFDYDASDFHTDEVFDSYEEVFNWAQGIAKKLGYVLIKRRTNSNLAGVKNKVTIVCNLSGQIDKRANGLTKKTLKCECPFRLDGRLTSDVGWRVTVVDDRHNHYPTYNLEGYAYARRLTEDERSFVEAEYHRGTSPRRIIKLLKEEFPGNLARSEDIYNFRKALRKKAAEKHGNTPMQEQMQQLWDSQQSSPNPMTEEEIMEQVMGTRGGHHRGCGRIVWGSSLETSTGSQGKGETSAGSQGKSETSAGSQGKGETRVGSQGKRETTAGSQGKGETTAGSQGKGEGWYSQEEVEQREARLRSELLKQMEVQMEARLQARMKEQMQTMFDQHMRSQGFNVQQPVPPTQPTSNPH